MSCSEEPTINGDMFNLITEQILAGPPLTAISAAMDTLYCPNISTKATDTSQHKAVQHSTPRVLLAV